MQGGVPGKPPITYKWPVVYKSLLTSQPSIDWLPSTVHAVGNHSIGAAHTYGSHSRGGPVIVLLISGWRILYITPTQETLFVIHIK